MVRTDVSDAESSPKLAHDVVGALHFAAKGLIGGSVRKPLTYFRENGQGGGAFLEALRAAARALAGRCAILRYFNAAGADSDGDLGEDHDTHLFPLIVRAPRGETPPLTVYGEDYDPRGYVHFDDLASGHLMELCSRARQTWC